MNSLQESINKFGLLSRLIVKKIGNGKYELIDGFNRLGCLPDDSMVPVYVMNTRECIDVHKSKISTRRYKK